MDIATLLSTDRIIFTPEVSSTKRAFELLSERLCHDLHVSELSVDSVFDALVAREKLGSTALGNGIAIPHACTDINQARAALLVLEEGLSMDTPDKKPVHMLLALLVPENNSARYRPLLSELTSGINRRDLAQQVIQYQDPRLTLDLLSSLFTADIRDMAA